MFDLKDDFFGWFNILSFESQMNLMMIVDIYKYVCSIDPKQKNDLKNRLIKLQKKLENEKPKVVDDVLEKTRVYLEAELNKHGLVCEWDQESNEYVVLKKETIETAKRIRKNMFGY